MKSVRYSIKNSMPSVPEASRSFPHASGLLLDPSSTPGKGSPWSNCALSILKMAKEGKGMR